MAANREKTCKKEIKLAVVWQLSRFFDFKNKKFSKTMPPKKKNQQEEDLGAMRAARFGRVKNTLTMGFGEYYIV